MKLLSQISISLDMTFRNLFLFLFLTTCLACQKKVDFNATIAIPTTGNSWTINDVFRSTEIISKDGITQWDDSNDIIRTYFHIDEPIDIPFGIKAKVKSGESKLKITFGETSKNITLNNTSFDTIFIDTYKALSKGYHYIDMQGVSRTDINFAVVPELLLDVEVDSTIKYVKDDFYFGRRGPSTHLVFETPTDDIEWMYSEIEIDEGQDVQGCYFVANGFGEGYFGIQVNSATERRVLFSIWSPYKTDDPNSIPEEYKIKLLKKGNGVTTGEFGNEGSGGQSYKVFHWKSEVRYKFLTHIKPYDQNNTDYTAYFFDPESDQWHLIASFRRPKTSTYLTRPYSFLENFIPNTGALNRRGNFYNQWMRDSKGNWHEITQARFSADATARKDARLDYSGGSLDNGFFLRNCGFTNHNTAIDTLFKRSSSKIPPSIGFSSLE